MLLLCGRRQQDGRHARRLVVGAARQERLQHVYMAVSLVCPSLQLSCGQASGTRGRTPVTSICRRTCSSMHVVDEADGVAMTGRSRMKHDLAPCIARRYAVHLRVLHVTLSRRLRVAAAADLAV